MDQKEWGRSKYRNSKKKNNKHRDGGRGRGRGNPQNSNTANGRGRGLIQPTAKGLSQLFTKNEEEEEQEEEEEEEEEREEDVLQLIKQKPLAPSVNKPQQLNVINKPKPAYTPKPVDNSVTSSNTSVNFTKPRNKFAKRKLWDNSIRFEGIDDVEEEKGLDMRQLIQQQSESIHHKTTEEWHEEGEELNSIDLNTLALSIGQLPLHIQIDLNPTLFEPELTILDNNRYKAIKPLQESIIEGKDTKVEPLKPIAEIKENKPIKTEQEDLQDLDKLIAVGKTVQETTSENKKPIQKPAAQQQEKSNLEGEEWLDTIL